MDLTTYAALVVITAALQVSSQSAPDLPDDFGAEVAVPTSKEPSEVGSAVEQIAEGDTRRPTPVDDAPAEPLQTLSQHAQSSRLHSQRGHY